MDAAVPLREGTESDRELTMLASFTRRIFSRLSHAVWLLAFPQARRHVLKARRPA